MDEQPQFSAFQQTKFFVSLNALRCVAILAVIWHHGAAHMTRHPFLMRGYLGVDFFFVISGFLITTLLLREQVKYGRISMRGFYMRRSLRIFPLYYAVLLLYVIVIGAFESNPVDRMAFFDNLPYFLTYTSNLFVHRDDGQRLIFYFVWSLATEEQFYLMWPWIERLGNRRISVAIAGLLIVAFLVIQILMPVAPTSLPLAVLWNVAPGICLGVLLAHGLHARSSFERLSKFMGGKSSCLFWIAVLGLAVHFLNYTDEHTATKPIGRVIVAAAMMMLVGSFVIRQDHILAQVSRFRPFVWIGTVSYGVYLLHMLSLNVARAVISRTPEISWIPYTVQLFVVTTVISVAAASISFRFFESFFNRLKSRFSADEMAVLTVLPPAPLARQTA